MIYVGIIAGDGVVSSLHFYLVSAFGTTCILYMQFSHKSADFMTHTFCFVAEPLSVYAHVV